MPTATRQPSGKYMCRVWDNYRKKQVAFTASTKKEAEKKALLYKYELKENREGDPTLGSAMNEYIESRRNILSPRTIADYKKNANKHYAPLKAMKLSQITDKDIQEYINQLADEYSPKTVKNLYSLLHSAFSYAMPSRMLRVALPKMVKPILTLPTENDVQSLLECVEGHPLCPYVYLAAFGALRRGEACALDYDHISFTDKTITVEFDIVQNEHNEWIKKPPKTKESQRTITVPKVVIDKIRKYGLVEYTPIQLSHEFAKFLKKNNLPPFTYHSLRHFCAAKQLSIPLALATVKKYGGWESDDVLLRIYNYELEESKKQATVLWNEYAERITKKGTP